MFKQFSLVFGPRALQLASPDLKIKTAIEECVGKECSSYDIYEEI